MMDNMTENPPRICPLIWLDSLTEGKKYVRCEKECAWYMEREECCAMVALARNSRELKGRK